LEPQIRDARHATALHHNEVIVSSDVVITNQGVRKCPGTSRSDGASSFETFMF
jgi:hypothetical protein